MPLVERPPAPAAPMDLELIVGDSLLDVDPAEVKEARAWKPTTMAQAEWAMRMCADAQRVIDDVTAMLNEEAMRLQEWELAATKRSVATIAFFTPLLEEYALRVRAETAGASQQKSVKLPSGEVTTRFVGGRIEVTDEATLLAFLAVTLQPQEWSACVKTTDHVLVGKLGAFVLVAEDTEGNHHVITRDAEPVPGVQWVADRVSAKISPRP